MAAVASCLEECDRVESGDSKAAMRLRSIEAADFEEALKDVSPSTVSDSIAMQELSRWNDQYGEGSKSRRSDYDPKLSYFL